MTTVRKNHSRLSAPEQKRFIRAINQLHGTSALAPAYRAFVAVHARAMSMAGMMWEVHTMSVGMPGTNFLAWHRHFLLAFEQRLQQVDPAVSIPYWDWITDPAIPAFLNDPALLAKWSVERSYTRHEMPSGAELDLAMRIDRFPRFQRKLELGPHSDVHLAVGGTMATAVSPADPLFWLHHANLDRLWSTWQVGHPREKPPKPKTVLQPASMFDVTIASQLDIAALGYRYH
jgi:tyrosinase